MLEFIITPRQKYLRNFSLPGELQAYFTSFYLLVCFVGFYVTFFSPSVLFYCIMSYAQYQQVYFFFCLRNHASNKPCALYFSSCCNKCSAIFTPKHRWYLKSKGRVSSENAGCTHSLQECWSPNPARCFAATIWYNLQLHLLMNQYGEFRGE